MIPSIVHKVMRVATGSCLTATNEYPGESSHMSAAQNSLYTPIEPVCWYVGVKSGCRCILERRSDFCALKML